VRAALETYMRRTAAMRLMVRGLAPSLTTPLIVAARDQATPQGRGALLFAMLPYFLILSALLGGMWLAVDSTAGERERASLEPPAPVSFRPAGTVHPRLAAKTEHVLRRDDGERGTGRIGELDQTPVRLARIEAGGGPFPRAQAREPAGGRVCVVRARVRDRVHAMVRKGVRVAPSTAEGPQEHHHPWKPQLIPQPVDRRSDVAEILGDQREVAELPLDRAEELGAGAGPPAPAQPRSQAAT
jgi:hypothetical protein